MIDAYEESYDSSSAWDELKGARFEACTFRNVNWAEADLRQSRFEDCTFTDCDLSNQGPRRQFSRRAFCEASLSCFAKRS